VTETLAFLIDHDPDFARSLADALWSDEVDERPPAAAYLAARTQLTVPGAAIAPNLFPDLSICGTRAAFQVLVEVRVTAEFHTFPRPQQEPLFQPEAYIAGWRAAAESLPEERRRVATISPAGPTLRPPSDRMRGADVRWDVVLDLVLALATTRGGLMDPIGSIALDLVASIDEVLRPTPPRLRRPRSPELAALVTDWREPLEEALRLLEGSYPGVVRARRMPPPAADYLACYLDLDAQALGRSVVFGSGS
jgi:hypothetical protein